jgi:hypothetical protein
MDRDSTATDENIVYIFYFLCYSKIVTTLSAVEIVNV